MKASSKVVCIVKWVAPLLALALTCAWWFSNEHVFILNGPRGTGAAISGGLLCVSIDTPHLLADLQPKSGIQDYYSDYRWWFDAEWRKSVKAVYFPIWLIVGACVGLAAFAWRADMKANRARLSGACRKCGYDRAGIPSGTPCPECGAATIAA